MEKENVKYELLWSDVEGDLSEKRIQSFPYCLEKIHLMKIREMLAEEQLYPDNFVLVESPSEGVYIVMQENHTNYFTLYEEKGELIPHFCTKTLDQDGHNCFPCSSIRECIQKTKW